MLLLYCSRTHHTRATAPPPPVSNRKHIVTPPSLKAEEKHGSWYNSKFLQEVTCIQFNPVDDNYFISGSLDAKVRIWSIPDRQVVDWTDMHEMVAAACYTPDGQSALVCSYKGSCHLYNTSGQLAKYRFLKVSFSG
ncbi:hypothetical protein S83_035279 [Arachis hypogaea]